MNGITSNNNVSPEDFISWKRIKKEVCINDVERSYIDGIQDSIIIAE